MKMTYANGFFSVYDLINLKWCKELVPRGL